MSRKNVPYVILLMIIVVNFAKHVDAVYPHFWQSGNLDTLEPGQPDGIAITHEGAMYLSRSQQIIAELSSPVFSVIPAEKETYIVGTGDVSALYRCSPKQESELIDKIEGLAVHAMVKGPKGNIFVGNHETRSVDIISTSGDLIPFFAVDDQYIWDMIWDKKGNLFVATGNRGRVYRVDSKGNGELYFDSSEEHIMELALTPDGKLLAGSEGNGVLFLIKGKDDVSVLFDTELTEISDIAVTSTGDIYFSAIPSFMQRLMTPIPIPQPGPSSAPQTESQQPDNADTNALNTKTNLAMIQQQLGAKEKGESFLYVLPKEGAARKVWGLTGKLILALSVDKKDRLYVGTGNEACLYTMDVHNQPILLYKFSAENIISMNRGPEDDLLIGTSSPGSVIRLTSKYRSQGEYVSKPVDALVPSRWGAIEVTSSVPSRTKLNVFFRTGNSAEPDKTWSDWLPVTSGSIPTDSIEHATQYAQYKVSMASSNSETSPVLHCLSLSYQQVNIPPSINKFEATKPAFEWYQSQDAGNNQHPFGDTSIFGLQQDNNSMTKGIKRKNSNNEQRTQKFSWNVTDVNGDKLFYHLFFKPSSQQKWYKISEYLENNSYLLNTDQLADGIYDIKLIATDSRTNPLSASYSDEAYVHHFIVDNTAPELTIKNIEIRENGCCAIEGIITDALNRIAWGEYSIDGKDWVFFEAGDSIYDQKQEFFIIEICSLESGEHILIIQGADEQNNRGRSFTTLSLP